MRPTPATRGGRPRGFDRDEAVRTAMLLFWRHGYEGVSISDLTEAIGIAPPSLYAAFGNKAALFAEALALYEAGAGAFDVSRVDGATSLDEAVRRLLTNGIRAVTDPARERGCMISSGVLACRPEHEAVARLVSERRAAMREAIGSMLRPWVGEGRADALARYLAAVLQGISVQARDGASAADLQVIADQAVAGLSAHPVAEGHRARPAREATRRSARVAKRSSGM